MKESITLYFVGFYKHNGIRGMFDGPFTSWDDADLAREKRGSQYRVVRIVLPITEMEILQ